MQIFLPFHCWKPTTWPANDCLQIMVCSCTMPFNSVRLQIIFWFLLMRKWNNTFLFLATALEWKWQIALQIIKKQTRWWNNKTIIKLGYRKISLFVQCLLYQSFSLHNRRFMNQAIGERGILREARDERETREERRRKNKAPRNKSIIVALPPMPTPTNIDWRRLCQKDQWKVENMIHYSFFLATRNSDSSITIGNSNYEEMNHL